MPISLKNPLMKTVFKSLNPLQSHAQLCSSNSTKSTCIVKLRGKLSHFMWYKPGFHVFTWGGLILVWSAYWEIRSDVQKYSRFCFSKVQSIPLWSVPNQNGASRSDPTRRWFPSFTSFTASSFTALKIDWSPKDRPKFWSRETQSSEKNNKKVKLSSCCFSKVKIFRLRYEFLVALVFFWVPRIWTLSPFFAIFTVC